MALRLEHDILMDAQSSKVTKVGSMRVLGPRYPKYSVNGRMWTQSGHTPLTLSIFHPRWKVVQGQSRVL